MPDSDITISSRAGGLLPPPSEHTAGGLSIYKSGQGYYTRMGTVIGVSLTSMLGILWAWNYLKNLRISGVNELYVAAAGAIAIGGIITAITYYLVFVKPRTVDFLIATEGEMKKVNWSTRREIIGSTTAVITTALILAVYCWVLEIGFVAFFRLIKVLDS
jgi:preprotein translocase subunit SecE